MKRFLKITTVALCMMLVLSSFASCDFLNGIFGGGEDDVPNTPVKPNEPETPDEPETPEAPEYTVNFDFGDATLPEGFEESVKVTEDGKIDLPTLEKEGFNFLGWYVGDVPFSEIGKVTEDMTLTAKWEIKKVTVTFQNFIGETVKVETIDWGTAATAPDVDTEAQGKPFLGWSSDITCVKEDITVKPIYDHPSYIITFNVGSATAIADQKVYMGEKPVKPEDPYKAGYTLAGWYLEATHENEYKFDTALDTDTTLYAKFNLDYIMVSTAEELNNIRNDTAAKYLLTNDINFEGDEWIPIETFSGIIDGNGHKIYNFTLSGSGYNLGFINTNTGTIKNLNFDEFNFKHNYNVSGSTNVRGGVIAALNMGVIKNCILLSGKIEFQATFARYEVFSGAIVGQNAIGIVSECVNNVDVYMTGNTVNPHLYLSSAIGLNDANGIIKKTVTYGNIIVETSNKIKIGGITAQNQTSCEIIDCAALIDINLDIADNFSCTVGLGTIVGYNISKITDCYAEGAIKVTNSSAVTGLIGGAVGISENESAATNIYADVDIILSDKLNATVGGIVGNTDAGSVVNKAVYTGNITAGTKVTAYGFIAGNLGGTTLNCYYDAANVLTVGEEVKTEGTCTEGASAELTTLQSEEFVYNTLYWDPEIWQINEGSNPTLKCFADR